MSDSTGIHPGNKLPTAHNLHVWSEDHLAQKYFQLHKSNNVLEQTKNKQINKKCRHIHLRDWSFC